MIRLVVKLVLSNPSGEVEAVRYKTFDIESTEIENYLTQDRGYSGTSLVGAEIIKRSSEVRDAE